MNNQIVKKVLYWFLMILILLGINTSSFVWLAYQFVESKVVGVSYWDVSALKGVPGINLLPNEYFDIYEKGLIYVFMGIGFILSVMFIKWLFVDTVTQIREKQKEKRKIQTYEEFKKELE